MKSPAFSYYEAKDLADAINIKKSDDDAVILAGGQSLLPTLNMRLSSPSVLIDIGSINELKKIKVEDCLLYTSPSPRDTLLSRMPSSA